MPLGSYVKDEIREIARNIGLDIANKKDSQEICFIPQDDYKQFLKKCIFKIKPGNIKCKGEKMGQHKGSLIILSVKEKACLSLGTPYMS